MKSAFVSFVLFAIFSVSVGMALASEKPEKLWRGSTITADVAAKRWGTVEFDAEKFKAGDVKLRASMTASLAKHMQTEKNQFVKKSANEVRAILGPFSGFYFTDAYPTYLIQVGKSHAEETWQIVFRLDRDRHVSGMMIHKNCCEP